MTVNQAENTAANLVQRIVLVYRESATVFGTIKADCAERRAGPPSRCLEEDIDQAPQEIERVKSEGIIRLKTAFQRGDLEATTELRDILEELESELLKRLQKAAAEPQDVEYRSLEDAADCGRDRTIAALVALEGRLAGGDQPVGKTTSRNASTSPKTSPCLSGQPSEGVSMDDTDGGGEDEAGHRHRINSHSLLNLFKHHHRHRSDSQGSRKSSSHLRIPSPRSGAQTPSLQSISGAGDGDEDPLEMQEASSGRGSVGSDSVSVRSDKLTRAATSPRPSVPSSTSTLNASARGGSAKSLSTASVQPSAENDYLGFCKGAVRLQAGDRQAMQRTKEFNDGWSSSSVYHLTCSNPKCAFATHMAMDIIWTKVWFVGENGIQFRWTFLAKSHVPQTKVKNHEYAYQCLFCSLSGAETPVLRGTDAYIDHIDLEHRGHLIDDAILRGAHCVTDRICDESEDFDINLFPLTIDEREKRRKSSGMLSNEVVVGFEKSGSLQRAPLTQEPMREEEEEEESWCSELSNFHTKESFETGGTELSLRTFRSEG